MSTRYNDGSHYENHQRAAELHDAAAHAHGRPPSSMANRITDGAGAVKADSGALSGAYRHSQEVHQKATNEHGIALFGHAEIAALASALASTRVSRGISRGRLVRCRGTTAIREIEPFVSEGQYLTGLALTV